MHPQNVFCKIAVIVIHVVDRMTVAWFYSLKRSQLTKQLFLVHLFFLQIPSEVIQLPEGVNTIDFTLNQWYKFISESLRCKRYAVLSFGVWVVNRCSIHDTLEQPFLPASYYSNPI